MNEKLIHEIGCWLKYAGAVLAWASDAWVNFPAKAKYFTKPTNGKTDTSKNNQVSINDGGLRGTGS